MNIKDISTQLMYTTVPVYTINEDGSKSVGTGFFYSIDQNENETIPLLITNHHVVEHAKEGFIEMHIAEKDKPTNKSIQVRFDSSIKNNKLGNLDLVAIPFAAVLSTLSNQGFTLFYRTISPEMIPSEKEMNDLAAIEEITFIGYPNGLYDEVNKMSIVRQGITATPIWNNFKGKDIFLVDAGVFPGSSGSPVFIYNRGSFPTIDGIAIGNRLLFVGVLAETVLSKNKDNKEDYLDLGVAINSKAIKNEIEEFVLNLKKRQHNG